MSGTINGQSFGATEILAPFPLAGPGGTRILTITGRDASTTLQFTFAALAIVGITPIGGLSPTNASLGEVPPPMVPGLWIGNATGGSGSVTISTLTDTRATGSYAVILIPTGSFVGRGNRTVNGTFDVMFADTLQTNAVAPANLLLVQASYSIGR